MIDDKPDRSQVTLISGPLTDEQREQLANSKRVWRGPIEVSGPQRSAGHMPDSISDTMTTPPNETLGAFLGDAAEKITKAERAAIVAWLRECGWLYVAEVIEAGEYHAAAVNAPDIPATCGVCEHWSAQDERLPACLLDDEEAARDARHRDCAPPVFCPLRKVKSC